MEYQQQSNIILNYFASFATKDIDKASRDFGSLIELKDWEIYLSGKDDVEDAIQGIFNSVKSIIIIPTGMYFSEESSDTVLATCKINILINGDQHLEVVDLITLTSDLGVWEITKIDAYKR
jgi:hypothetical protein